MLNFGIIVTFAIIYSLLWQFCSALGLNLIIGSGVTFDSFELYRGAFSFVVALVISIVLLSISTLMLKINNYAVAIAMPALLFCELFLFNPFFKSSMGIVASFESVFLNIQNSITMFGLVLAPIAALLLIKITFNKSMHPSGNAPAD